MVLRRFSDLAGKRIGSKVVFTSARETRATPPRLTTGKERSTVTPSISALRESTSRSSRSGRPETSMSRSFLFHLRVRPEASHHSERRTYSLPETRTRSRLRRAAEAENVKHSIKPKAVGAILMFGLSLARRVAGFKPGVAYPGRISALDVQKTRGHRFTQMNTDSEEAIGLGRVQICKW